MSMATEAIASEVGKVALVEAHGHGWIGHGRIHGRVHRQHTLKFSRSAVVTDGYPCREVTDDDAWVMFSLSFMQIAGSAYPPLQVEAPMRQGSIVTGLLLVVGLPIAFFADGGWDGVKRDVGRALAAFQFTAPAIGQAARSKVSASQGERAAAETAVGSTVLTAAALMRKATGALPAAASSSPYLIAPGRNYAAGGVDPDDINITGGILGTARAADGTALQVANIADPQP